MNAVVQLPSQSAGALAQQSTAGRMAVADIISHVATVQEVMRAVMKGPSKEHPQGVHYGIIPGTDKPTLLKPGAEVLCMAFRIADSYQIEDLSADGVVRYRVTCTGTHQTTGIVLGTGMGEASSGEEKYKWRKATSPKEFEETPPNLRRTKHVKPRNGDGYSIQQVRTEPADLANTILKMANKRAKMAMVLNVTAASDCFAQDLEDMDDALRDHLARHGDDLPTQDGEGAATKKTTEAWTEEEFEKAFPAWQKAVGKGKTPQEVLQTIAQFNPGSHLTEPQKARILALKKDAQTDLTPKNDSGPDPEVVLKNINAAQDLDQLALAGDRIRDIKDAEAKKRVQARFDEREADFQGAN